MVASGQANEFPRPRFGQGAFAHLLEALHLKVTGQPLSIKYFGKPNREPYALAERLLLRQARQLRLLPPPPPEQQAAEPVVSAPAHAPAVSAAANPGAGPAADGQGGGDPGGVPTASAATEKQLPLHFSAIFAVGDNPAADVRGANSAGHPWVSVLVRTGVFAGPPGANDPHDPAALVVEDVAAAVEAALHRTRHARWHSMR